MTSPTFALSGITIDCDDPVRVAGFWSQILQAETRNDPDLPGWLRLGPTVQDGPHINFQPVPEGKSAKARIHLDLWVNDLTAATLLVRQLGGSGPTETHTYETGTVNVMADPEGNEFCLVAETLAVQH